jgi:predicted nuclease of predicted toxin-antitoxin system
MIWLDAHLSPLLAPWITHTFGEPCRALREIGLLDAPDALIYQRAREEDVVVMTKDRDFVELLYRYGPPPRVIWITSGNTSNSRLKEILIDHLPTVLNLLDDKTPLVEIR